MQIKHFKPEKPEKPECIDDCRDGSCVNILKMIACVGYGLAITSIHFTVNNDAYPNFQRRCIVFVTSLPRYV